jgi:hypothetical protein
LFRESSRKAISQSFLPALFGYDFDEDDPRLRLAGLPVKHAGMALPDPITSAKSNYEASSSRGVRTELKTRKKAKDDLELNSIISKLPCDLRRAILRGKATGQWISVMPSTVIGTVLSAKEYRDAFLVHFWRCPGDIQPHCDGCACS